MRKIVRKTNTKEKRAGMMYFREMEGRKRTMNPKSNLLPAIEEDIEPVKTEEMNFFGTNHRIGFRKHIGNERLNFVHQLRHISMSCTKLPTISEIAEYP